jgi:hypothetical protein
VTTQHGYVFNGRSVSVIYNLTLGPNACLCVKQHLALFGKCVLENTCTGKTVSVYAMNVHSGMETQLHSLLDIGTTRGKWCFSRSGDLVPNAITFGLHEIG